MTDSTHYRRIRDSLPDNRWEGMFIKQTIGPDGTRVWEVWEYNKLIGTASSQMLAESLWLETKYGTGKFGTFSNYCREKS